MAHLNSTWVQFLAQLGNEPGNQQGDVLIELAAPVEGQSSITCPTDTLNIAVEAGVLLALHVVLPDGRRVFIPAQNIAAIIDAPVAAHDKPARPPVPGRKRTLP